MKRMKLVLALLAVMVATLVAFSAPALANDHRDNDPNDRWDDNRRWDNDWDWNHNRDHDWWVNDWDWDHDRWEDDCEWEWEEEGGYWALGPWGWYWQPLGFWELDC